MTFDEIKLALNHKTKSTQSVINYFVKNCRFFLVYKTQTSFMAISSEDT